MTTLADAAAACTEVLRAAGVASPAVDARWLVEAASGSDPRRHGPAVLTEDGQRTLAELLARRCAREPLQLIVGTTAFRGLTLRCRAGVFVPRPETEVLAGLAIDHLRARIAARDTARDGAQLPDVPLVVEEPCCGTGAVGLAIASEVAGARVLLGDRSAAAVRLATENRDRLAAQGALRSPVEVGQGDLLDAFVSQDAVPPDLIVANPPYLPTRDLAGLAPEVADHDPHDALFGGPDGHEVVDGLLAAAAGRLVPGGVVLLEIDARRAARTLAVAHDVGLADAVVLEDLTGAPRFVRAHRPEPDRARG